MSENEVVEVLKTGAALIQQTRWGYPIPAAEGDAWLARVGRLLESLEPRVQRRQAQRDAAHRQRAASSAPKPRRTRGA